LILAGNEPPEKPAVFGNGSQWLLLKICFGTKQKIGRKNGNRMVYHLVYRFVSFARGMNLRGRLYYSQKYDDTVA